MVIMSTQLIFSLILAFLVCGAHMATVSITNNCAYTVWPGTLANADHPQLAETGFELATRGTKTLNIPAKWAGSFWARTQCSGSFTCATADCGSGQVACNGKGAVPPVSLVAIAFQSDDGQDFYTLSGFNLPVSVAPENGSGSKCIEATCLANANQCGQGYSSPSDPSSVLACTSGTNYAITFCP